MKNALHLSQGKNMSYSSTSLTPSSSSSDSLSLVENSFSFILSHKKSISTGIFICALGSIAFLFKKEIQEYLSQKLKEKSISPISSNNATPGNTGITKQKSTEKFGEKSMIES
jgi:hypothetical protein